MLLHIINGVNIYFVTLNKINPTLIRHWSVIVKKDGIFKLENWYLLCAQKICNYTQRAETCALEMKRLSWHWNIAVKQKNGIFKSKNQYCYEFQELLVKTTHLNVQHIYNIKKLCDMWLIVWLYVDTVGANIILNVGWVVYPNSAMNSLRWSIHYSVKYYTLWNSRHATS